MPASTLPLPIPARTATFGSLDAIVAVTCSPITPSNE